MQTWFSQLGITLEGSMFVTGALLMIIGGTLSIFRSPKLRTYGKFAIWLGAALLLAISILYAVALSTSGFMGTR
jgi:hypothetical protein